MSHCCGPANHLGFMRQRTRGMGTRHWLQLANLKLDH
jgi:hypothetical protein